MAVLEKGVKVTVTSPPALNIDLVIAGFLLFLIVVPSSAITFITKVPPPLGREITPLFFFLDKKFSQQSCSTFDFHL